MEGEAFVFWTLIAAARVRRNDHTLDRGFLAEVREELIGMWVNTDWPALKKRLGAAIMDLEIMRGEVAA